MRYVVAEVDNPVMLHWVEKIASATLGLVVKVFFNSILLVPILRLDKMWNYMEIHVNTPVEICEARDPKGLYQLARADKIPNLSGLGSPYGTPLQPDFTFIAHGAEQTPAYWAQEIAGAFYG